MRFSTALFVLVLLIAPANAETILGRLVGIVDGATSTLLTHARDEVRVRFAASASSFSGVNGAVSPDRSRSVPRLMIVASP